MSAIIQIYQVDKDFDFTQINTYEKWKTWYHKQIQIVNEGGVKLNLEDFICFKKYSPRLRKQIKEIKNKYKDYIGDYGGSYPHQVLALKELLYRQGWFFKKKLFNNQWPIYYALNKKHMIHLLDQFIDIKCKRDDRGLEAYRACLDTFKDNEDMIFELSW